MNDELERVILVDGADRELGTAPKLAAHWRGDLHRAFSVLIHDGAGNMLLQKRHHAKYHSGGLWTNACCGHPRPGEDTQLAAQRRLVEEMGFACPLEPMQTFMYRAEVGNGLIEHEFVHLYSGCWHGDVAPNPAEAETHAWQPSASVREQVSANPDGFTAWFRLYLRDLHVA